MSDPLRTDPLRALEPASDAERDAKIEQLLLAGLDHYFAAQYEQAINVWTRALFFDRNHARARAYIDRARSALAERQRESEELLQDGVAAFNRGEGEEARRLLQAAINQGAPSDEALAVLGRLDRLEHGQAAQPYLGTTAYSGSRVTRPNEHAVRASRVGPIALAALVVVIVAAGLFVAAAARSERRSLVELPHVPATSPPPAPAFAEAKPPLPRRGEMALGRARALVLSGRLRDALTALESVRPTDPEKPEADRVRAEIQKQLIALANVPVATADSATGGARQP
jgi:tetratricopeptide (TPR) repeat protein